MPESNEIRTRYQTMIRDVRNLFPSFQQCRDESLRETQYNSPSYPSRRNARLFPVLVTAQADKNRRDRYQRDKVSKERKAEQQRNERRDHDIDKAMNPTKAPPDLRHQRGKRSMSILMRAVRPLSTAWGSERAVGTRPRTASELDFSATGKPALVLSLNDAETSWFETRERPFVFQLFTEDGGKWLLQTMSKVEAESWMSAFSIASRKRSTYISPRAGIKTQLEPLTVDTSRPGAGTSYTHVCTRGCC